MSDTCDKVTSRETVSGAQEALELARVATFEWDIRRNILFGNPLLAFFHGLSDIDAQGCPIEEYRQAVNEEDRAIADALIEKSLSTAAVCEAEYRIRDLDGKERWVKSRARTTFDDRMQPIWMRGVVLDISDRKEQERLNDELDREREKLQTLFRNAPAFIAVLRGRDLVFEYVNEHYYTIVGHREVLGLPLAKALPEVVGQGEGRDYDRVLLSVMDSGKPITFKERPALVQRVPGGPLVEGFLDLAYQPLTESDGTISGVLVHGVDVTDQALARHAISESERKYRTLFTSMHEGYCVVRLVLDDAGKPVDYHFLEVNDAFERLSGISSEAARSGKTARELFPEIEDHRVEVYGNVAITGVSARFTDVLDGRWFDVRAARVGEADDLQVAVLFNDVTERRQAELALEAERQQFRRLLDEVPGHVVTLMGSDLRYEFANKAFLEFIGRNDFIGMRAEEAWPVPEEHLAMLRGILRTGEPVSGIEVPVQDGIFDFIFHPLREADGTISGIFVHSLDVSEKVLVREALLKSEERFRTVQESTPDVFNMLLPIRGSDGEIVDFTWTYVNPAAEKLVGKTKEELLGASVLRFRPMVRENGLFEEFVRLAETGEPFTRELFIDYGPRPAYLRLTSVRVGDEIANSITDISDMKFAEMARAQAVEALKASNDALESKVAERTEELKKAVDEAEGFNYSISHDLRAPLRAIIATSSILLEEVAEELSPEHRHLLTRQAENANRLGRLIDELLRLSRLARVEVNRERLDMTRLAQSVSDELAAEYNGCVFEVQEGMVAEGDPNLTRTILENLIGNACKFSPECGTISVQQTGNVFSVTDQGVGFDMRYASKIFQPFERLVAEKDFPGTGIGLANVKRIVERHGGKVWAESSPGSGATFFFTLA